MSTTGGHQAQQTQQEAMCILGTQGDSLAPILWLKVLGMGNPLSPVQTGVVGHPEGTLPKTNLTSKHRSVW